MGASPDKESHHKIPAKGCRVMEIINPELQNKLQPFTDYIIAPSPQQLRHSAGEIHATIFSILDYSIRNETLPVSENHLGARIKVTNIQDCSLKVTKVFPNSPCERLGIVSDQYIVGLHEAEFTSLSSFAQALHTIINLNKEVFTLGVCDSIGITRLIPVSVAMVNEWKFSSQGLLGCQLAEGWMHRFKGKPKRQNHHTSTPEDKKEEIMTLRNQEIKNAVMREIEGQEGSEEWQQIERKVGGQAVGESLEVTFKGLLKNQYLQDASTICKCKLYDKSCQKCWVEREGGFHFFNKKTNRIITIPSSLLFRLGE